MATDDTAHDTPTGTTPAEDEFLRELDAVVKEMGDYDVRTAHGFVHGLPFEVARDAEARRVAERDAAGPTLTLAEAVEATGVARSTLQRRLKDGAIPGARRLDTGGWSIPYTGLVAAGLDPGSKPEKVDPAAEVSRLTAELAGERARRIAAEQLAAERSERIADVRRTVDALEAALADVRRQLPAAPAPSETPPTEPRRRRWWQS
jgi:hypothetical protein